MERSAPKFNPPLYRQRYAAVLDLARKLKPKRVLDVGCAECKLLAALKKEEYIEELVGVDIDEATLGAKAQALRPLTYDYLHPRPTPLHIVLMHGSIAQPDSRLKDFDLVTCVELIEHLDSPVLDTVPAALLGFLRPYVVVMTTPNAEFNVLFPGFTGFRHHDHRFEWTRAEFQTWCLAASRVYGYSVQFGGVGDPPAGQEGLGHCSQMATFTREGGLLPPMPLPTPLPPPSDYIVIAEIDHPHRKDTLTPEQKLRIECEYYLQMLQKSRETETEDDPMAASLVPLQDLLVFSRVRALASEGVQDIRRALESSSISFDVTGQFAVLPPEESEMLIEEEEEVELCITEMGTGDHVPTEYWD